MARIEAEFEEIKKTGAKFIAINADALGQESRKNILDELANKLEGGKIRILMHSIAFGALKLVAPLKESKIDPLSTLAKNLNLDAQSLRKEIDQVFSSGGSEFYSLASATPYDSELLLEDEALAETIFSMGTSLLTWTREVFMRKLFAPDARVIGLTSEGNKTAWLGYAAVSAAKVALESISRSIAREFAPHGIRSNIVQPGVTDTPALRLIPGNAKMIAQAKLKNPFGRITEPQDVANVIALLATDEASWINGSIVRVDGGECVSG